MSALDDFAEGLGTKNKAVAQKLNLVDKAVLLRHNLYYDEKIGLLARMTAVKSYVAGDFGKSSSAYKQLVALKF